MPGTIPNQNILDAIDQVIQALNDLATEVSGNIPDLAMIEGNIQTVGDNLEGVSDAITAQTTTQETRSIAEVTAQNTNFSDLVAAINGLSLVCAPEVNVQSATPDIYLSCPPPIVNVQCGGTTGNAPDDGTVDETDPAPEGGEPDPNITDRKCKAANLIYDELLALCEKLALQDADDLAAIGVAAASAMLGALIGSVVPVLGTVLGAVAGAIIGIVVAMITEVALQFDDITTAMSTNRSDIVCALYEATDTGSARSEVLGILILGGINSVESTFMALIMPNSYLKMLFQAIPGSEAKLDGYEVTIDCGDCGGTPEWWDCLYGAIVDYTDTTVTVNGALQEDGAYLASIRVPVVQTMAGSQTGWTTPPIFPELSTGVDDDGLWCGAGTGSPWDINTDTFQGGPFTSITTLLYRSGSPFTVTFTRS